MCYGRVGCLFDKVCCLCAIGKSVDHLIRFAACLLLEVGCLFDLVFCVVWESLLLVGLGLLPLYYGKVGFI